MITTRSRRGACLRPIIITHRRRRDAINRVSTLAIALLLALSSCRKDDSHLPVNFPPLQPNEAALTIALKLNVVGVTAEDINLYAFGADDKLCYHKYFANPKELANEVMVHRKEPHNFVVVINCGVELIPPDAVETRHATSLQTRATLPTITFAQFVEWTKEIDPLYPRMCTGWTMHDVTPGMNLVVIEIESGLGGLKMGTIAFTLALPSPSLPDYVAVRGVETWRAASLPYQLRTVAEAYYKGTNNLALRKVETRHATSLQTQPFEMTLGAGSYDIRLWADYVPAATTADWYYNTTNTRGITLANPATYTAGTDTKDAFFHTLTIDLPNERVEQTLDMIRPFAKYRLVATDVAKYLAANGTDAINRVSTLSDLTATIHYQGFFPSSINLATGSPNNSAVGVKYALPLTDTTEPTLEIASDYVLVNGGESSVTVTIVITDRAGKEISRVSDVLIRYRRNHLTTVSGDFLTAGQSGGGITINTTWDGVYEVNF